MLNPELADDADSAIVVAANLACKRKMASRGGGVSDENIKQVRAIMGPLPSDMDIIRALYQSKNDVAAAVNILFDTPNWQFKPRVVTAKRKAISNPIPPASDTGKPAIREPAKAPPGNGSREVPPLEVIPTSRPVTTQARTQAVAPQVVKISPLPSGASKPKDILDTGSSSNGDAVKPHVDNLVRPDPDVGAVHSQAPFPTPPKGPQLNTLSKMDNMPNVEVIDLTQSDYSSRQDHISTPLLPGRTVVKPHPYLVQSVTKLRNQQPASGLASSYRYDEFSVKVGSEELYTKSLLRLQTSWQEDLVLLGQSPVTCLSTCRGQKLNARDDLIFSFPKLGNDIPDARRGWGRGKAAAAAAEIVRFSTEKSGEIGRLPGEWARPLIPLVTSKKVAISAVCRYAPAVLGILDGITLELGIFVSRSLLKKYSASSASSISVSAEASTHNPLLSVLRLLGKKPFMKAEFTPEDLYHRKNSLDLDMAKKNGSSEPILPLEKRQKLTGVSDEENEAEEISETDLNKIVGSSEGSELMEMEPPSDLVCNLRPYQKQALHWMTKMESGLDLEDAAKTLHPCWEAYYLGDEKSVFYVNVFSGEASSDFPSALQTARGGILADAMGLGKTVMGIALLLASRGRGGQYAPVLDEPYGDIKSERIADLGTPSQLDVKANNQPSASSQLATQKSRTRDSSAKLRGGGTLIVCPMTLLGQWKTEIETHVKPGVLSILTYYGQDKTKESKSLHEYDIVLTTYGVLTADCTNQNAGVLQGVHWFRIVLDEAHTIKNLRTQASQAAFKLTADRRWCLTGTPIQNKLEDVFSLLHFLRIEPWGNLGWWTKLIQKPFDEGDERGLKLLQAVLKPLMLRRTKETVDKEGRPILVLPPADMQVIECELSLAERDFYEALFKKSKVKFDMFVEQGKVLHNYASILELLLRLRQCCDHPFLVMSRGDTDEFSDLNKLAKHFMNGGSRSGEGPTRAFVEEVVNDFRKGEKGECPICLEVVEDAVLTPCAHCLCRECLFASWPSYGGGLCPICRQHVYRQDLITAPKESRFQLDVEKNWRASSKVEALMQELEKIRLVGEKSVVFSQWTSFLDLLQIPLNRANFRFVRLDGSLSQQQREHVIKDFSSDPKILVMLISLKAGGVGVNLTAASHAFLLDPWWNPAVEEQAIMRIHRIGQIKDVYVKRFICKETVEQRMQQVQARKQRMIAGALNNQDVRAARLEELKMLFR